MEQVRIGRSTLQVPLGDLPPGPDGWLEAARRIGSDAPLPGDGRTADVWSLLAALGAADLQLARAVEQHLDALAILAEARAAGHASPDVGGATWGVFAAERPGARLSVVRSETGWRLTGTKPGCSLADRVSHALVTAWVNEDRRGLFAVDLRDPGVTSAPRPQDWAPRGLVDVVSLPVEMQDVPATPVGPPGWYLRRDGFAWGGIGVAAV